MEVVLMTKQISAGILVKVSDNYLVGHATDCQHFDIFKGRQEKGETYLETAIRECEEESGLQFSVYDLKDLGFYNYTKKKDLAIYIAKMSYINLEKLKCTSFLDNGKPEMDYYKLFDWDTLLIKLGHSMSMLIVNLEKEIKAF